MQVYRFRNCLLNAVERSVVKDQQHVELTTKTFDVLQFLIENVGKVVSKDEILGNVWSGNFVEESNLPVHISKIRRLLGETRETRFIETVQGIGYRFVSPVDVVTENEWQKHTRHIGAQRTASHLNTQSIAVLPLRNESGDPNNDYLADGLTESLINNLSHISGLKVIARDTVFRYKNSEVDLKEVGEALGVARLLTGRIRIADDCLMHVGVEVLSADDATQIWGEHYKGRVSDLLALQEKISFAVADNLSSVKLRREELLGSSLTRDPESYRLYLKGRYFLEKHSADDMHRAIELFKKSVSFDPDNIHSFIEIIECYRSLYAYGYISYPEFLDIIQPALSSVDGFRKPTDAVEVMHCDLKMLEWKFDEAAYYCRRALALNPASLKGRLRYSDLLLQSRDYRSALEQLETIINIDPLSPLVYKRIGRLFYLQGDYKNAVAYLNDALELEPNSHEALTLRGATYIELKSYEKAFADLQTSLKSEPHPETLSLIGVIYARQGKTAKAYQVIETVQRESKNCSGNAVHLAHIYLALGRKDKVYELLQRAYMHHEPDLRALNYDGRWVTLRRDAQFKELTKKIGLPTAIED